MMHILQLFSVSYENFLLFLYEIHFIYYFIIYLQVELWHIFQNTFIKLCVTENCSKENIEFVRIISI